MAVDPYHFFDRFPRFVDTSQTGAVKHRLNARYVALIHANRELIRGASVLDLASHDGRFSFAALDAGADRVVGVEYGGGLVQKARDNMSYYGVPSDKYDFVLGDIFEYLDRVRSYDVVFCFGIFYHITEHVMLLSRIAELQPRALILDTSVSSREAAVIEFINPYSGGSAQAGDVFEGHPSKAALDVMLASLGWTHEYFDWEHSELAPHPEMADYHRGQRVTAVVDCKRPTISMDAQVAAVQAVIERRLGRRWQQPTIKEVAKEYGLTPQALRILVGRAERRRTAS